MKTSKIIQIIIIVIILLIIVTKVKKLGIMKEAEIEHLKNHQIVIVDIIEEIHLGKKHLMINIMIKII